MNEYDESFDYTIGQYFGDFGLFEYLIGNMLIDDEYSHRMASNFDIAMVYLGWDRVFTI